MDNVIFINADDFGLDIRTNDNIKYCLSNNLISSTTLLANMQGFEHAIELIHKYNFHKRVGIHLNLVDGDPLSKEMRTFLAGEQLCRFKTYNIHHFYNEKMQHVIYHELCAQMDRVLEHSVVPTHIDTHSHVHNYYGILQLLNKLSIEYHIKYIRNTMNLFIERSIKLSILKSLYHRYRRYHRIYSLKYFTSLSSYIGHDCQLLNVELMCHPGDKKEFDFLCSDVYARFLNRMGKHIVLEPF